MHGNVPVRFGRGRLDSLGYKGLAAYLTELQFQWVRSDTAGKDAETRIPVSRGCARRLRDLPAGHTLQ